MNLRKKENSQIGTSGAHAVRHLSQPEKVRLTFKKSTSLVILEFCPVPFFYYRLQKYETSSLAPVALLTIRGAPALAEWPGSTYANGRLVARSPPRLAHLFFHLFGFLAWFSFLCCVVH